MKLLLSSVILMALSCSPTHKFNQDKPLFQLSKVEQRFKSVTDGNDCYFDIKQNNFFEFYRQLFDSVKNTSYPGRFTKEGDVMLLHFYDKKGEQVLGKKALIDNIKKEIIFFDYSPAVNKKFVFN